MSLIQFGSLELANLYEHGFPSLAMQEGFSLVSIFNTLAVNMTSYSEVEEEIGEANGRQEKFPTEIGKILVDLDAIPVRLNWEQIFCLLDETCQYMVTALKHPNSFLTRSIGPSLEKMVYS